MKKVVWIIKLVIFIIVIEVFLIGKMVFNGEINLDDMMNKNSYSISAFVKNFQRTVKANIDTTEVYIPINTVMQNPELPNGCEITSLTAVLNYYGYDVTKTEMSDKYLPKQPFIWKNNKLYGPNPYKAYAGDPRNSGGYFSYAPPIVKAANRYFEAIGEDNHSIDISGSSREEILEQLYKGIPIVIWVTLDLSKPKLYGSWYFYDTKEYFPAPSNMHVVVLNGYDGTKVRAMNPLQGQVTYDANKFFDSYQALGSHALIIEKNGN